LPKFQTQGLGGRNPRDAVTLTVKGTFEVDGHTALIQADDTIRVIGNAPKKGKVKSISITEGRARDGPAFSFGSNY